MRTSHSHGDDIATGTVLLSNNNEKVANDCRVLQIGDLVQLGQNMAGTLTRFR